MASVEKRVRNAKVTWLARWRDPDGKQRKRSFSRRIDADRFLTSVSSDMLHGKYVDPSDPTTVKDYAESWRTAQVHRLTTRAHVETNLRKHVYPYFGERRLASVRPSEIQAWVTTLSAKLSPSTVQVIHGIFAAIYKSAIRDHKVNASPCESTKLPKKMPHEIVPLTTKAIEELAEGIPPRYYALIVLAAGTGMRQGECFGLALDRVDFLHRTLRVDQQVILLPHREAFLAPPKTTASHRTIPLPQVVVEALAEHLRRYPTTHANGLIFTDEDGATLRRTRFSREVWRPTVAACPAVPAGTGFHDLRHYYASLLIRHGESIKTVQRRLGHATAVETLDTYSHLWPDSDERTREAIDAALGAVPPACPQGGVG
jgi:integrase